MSDLILNLTPAHPSVIESGIFNEIVFLDYDSEALG